MKQQLRSTMQVQNFTKPKELRVKLRGSLSFLIVSATIKKKTWQFTLNAVSIYQLRSLQKRRFICGAGDITPEDECEIIP
jgi:hypothetical protein